MTVIFVFAHPDDETFSSGGTIHKLTKSGHSVKLITATKGEAGSLGNPPIATKENIGKIREKELKKAAKILGVSQVIFLRFIDGTLHKISNKSLREKIFTILQRENPDIVVTFDKKGVSNHPDHIAVSKAATKAFYNFAKHKKEKVKLYHTVVPRSYIKKYKEVGLSYSAFGEMKGTPDHKVTTHVDINQEFEVKVKALKQHQTQKSDWEKYLKRETSVNLKVEFFQLVHEKGIL